ncbi:MAG: putative photosynthetic complex assembly protein PuhE [Pseudomonadota bacterium]
MTALAVIYAFAVWWSSTQAIIWFVRSAPRPALNAFALVLAILAAILAVMSTQEASVHAAFVGFTAGIGIWASFEIAFLTGAILGYEAPARSNRLSARAWSAFQAIAWHEAALIATLAGLLIASIGTPNPTAAATFAALWIMRASAKLNLFLGVRNLCTEFLPGSVVHLSKHFRRSAMNGFFPFSVLSGTIAAAVLLRAAFDPASSPDHATASMLISTLVALGILEHWLMITPLSALDLWSGRDRRLGRAKLAQPLGKTRKFV